MLALAIVIYAAAMTAANLVIVAFGPAISPLNSFLFIGLDLALRDWLHVRLRAWQMLSLIAASGVLTYLLNPAASTIAVASAAAFTLAAAVDWSVFSWVRGSWIKRSNLSNIAGAAVDSVTFPTLAFGVFMPHIVVMQFAAKVCGGAAWSWFLAKASNTNYSDLSAKDNPPKVPATPQITHAENCWSWGPAHYACACNEIAKLRGWHAQAGQDRAK